MTDLNALGAGGMSDFSGLGIALFPHDGEHADALLRRADAVMYEVKQMKGKRQMWWSMRAMPASTLD